jgi:hypothetical protein
LHLTSAGFGGSESENRPEALAAGEDRVAHSLVHGFRANSNARQKPVEGVVHEDLLAFEISFKIGHGAEPNRNFRQGNWLLRRSEKEVLFHR